MEPFRDDAVPRTITELPVQGTGLTGDAYAYTLELAFNVQQTGSYRIVLRCATIVRN